MTLVVTERVRKNGYIHHTELVGPAQNVCIAYAEPPKGFTNCKRTFHVYHRLLVHSCSEACAISDKMKNSMIP